MSEKKVAYSSKDLAAWSYFNDFSNPMMLRTSWYSFGNSLSVFAFLGDLVLFFSILRAFPYMSSFWRAYPTGKGGEAGN
jgi:hypothetical protein